MISITKNLRSAAIVAAAILTLAATSALAQNLSTSRPSHSPESKSSAAPKASDSAETTAPNVESTEKPDVETTEAAKTDKTDPDHHGDCVSAIAKGDTTAPNTHGQTNHGWAVRKAAHGCGK
jgi:hypothetical protein